MAGSDPSPSPEELEAEVEELRARTAELEAQLDKEDGSPAGGGRHRARSTIAVVLLVVGSLLAPIAVTAIWTRNLVSDTDRYVQTVTPLAEDPAIQQLVADRVTQALFDQVDVNTLVSEALPEDGQFLVGPLTTGLRTAVREATLRLIQSDQFQALWVSANRLAHTQLVAVLTGEGSNAIKTDNGTVALDLTGILAEVNRQLQESGIDLFASVSLPEGAVTIPIFQSDDITRAQVAFKAFDRLATLLPWISLLMLVGGALLMQNRRRGLAWAAAGVATGMLALLLGLTLGRTIYLGAIPSSVVPGDAAAAFFDTIMRFLRQGSRAVLAVSIIVLVVALVMGPSDAAVRLRRTTARLVGRVGDEAGERVDFGPVGAFVGNNLLPLRIATGVGAVLVLLAWEQPTAGTVFIIALLALLVLGVLEVLGQGGKSGAEEIESPAES